jgi:hypothetical protein
VPRHKFRKFERSQTPPSFRIGEADLKILEFLADYRFLDTKQILALFPSQTERNIKRRLLFLYHSGYIDRPAQQFTYSKPSDYLVYTLAKKGAELISQKKGLSAEAKPSKEIGVSFLRHSLMISGFRLILNLALTKNTQFKVIVWKDLGSIDAVYSEGERLPIAPDAFFTIESKDYLMYFFLEADRSTMTQERMLNKFKGYWIWRAEGRQKQKLDIANFRVLTVCLSTERAENLRQVARKADASEIGSEMFWFACEKAFNLANPESILKPIWRTPKNETVHQILE